MTWFRLDDGWLTHPTMQAAGLDGRGLWLAAGLHSAQHLTDGRIDKHLVKMLAAQTDVRPSVARRLLELGLWTDEGDHYQMRNYLDYQPSKEHVEAERERWKRNKKRGRSSRVSTEDTTEDTTEDSPEDSPENPAESPRPPVPTKGRDGCTEASACTTAASAAAEIVTPAVALIAQRRGVDTRAARKDNPAAWQAAATKAIRAEVVTAAETAATLAPHLPHHTEAARPGDGHSDPNAGKPAGDTITLTAEALADLIEPAPAPPPLRPEERTQRAAQALATRDRTCPHCHGSGVTLDDDGTAHECHHPTP